MGELPKYVTLLSTTLKLKNGSYWRDAGEWGVDAIWKEGKLLAVSEHKHLDGQEMKPTTKQIYLKDNEGYV
jgi:hypothetical protein